MAYQPNQDDDRKWYEGDWACGKCGAKITKLPFEPDENRLNQLQCRDCYRNSRPQQGGRF